MKILVDFRERKQVHMLEEVCDDVQIMNLPLGDYLVPGKEGAVIVERKSVADLLSSIRSNRLWDQLLRLMKRRTMLDYSLKRRILMIHGKLSYIPWLDREEQLSERRRLLFWSQMMGALQEIFYVYDTPVVMVENDVAFKAFFRILMKRELKGQNDKAPDARWYRKRLQADLPTKDRKRYLLSAIPSIGEVLAKKLLNHFNTISEIANASPEELQQVNKIGKKKAELIFNIFHR